MGRKRCSESDNQETQWKYWEKKQAGGPLGCSVMTINVTRRMKTIFSTTLEWKQIYDHSSWKLTEGPSHCLILRAVAGKLSSHPINPDETVSECGPLTE